MQKPMELDGKHRVRGGQGTPRCLAHHDLFSAAARTSARSCCLSKISEGGTHALVFQRAPFQCQPDVARQAAREVDVTDADFVSARPQVPIPELVHLLRQAG